MIPYRNGMFSHRYMIKPNHFSSRSSTTTVIIIIIVIVVVLTHYSPYQLVVVDVVVVVIGRGGHGIDTRTVVDDYYRSFGSCDILVQGMCRLKGMHTANVQLFWNLCVKTVEV